jgi:hypothetical protein
MLSEAAQWYRQAVDVVEANKTADGPCGNDRQAQREATGVFEFPPFCL